MPNHFQRELDKLRKRVLSLGAQVEDRLRLAAKALEGSDIFDAERIIKTDHQIDVEEVEIEEDCLKILALHQPVAGDLRFLIATIKINNDLERIGDETVNIAWQVKAIVANTKPGQIPYDYAPQIKQVQRMLNLSLDSLVGLDQDRAFKVLTLDDEVDSQHHEMCKRGKADIVADPSRVECLMPMYLISRHIERIGDHATNIAEEVIYMIEGEIVRHNRFEDSQ